jgi:MerR family transcriptional regulator/heat shock protein HspR
MISSEDYDEPRYVISVVTKLVDLHPQTLRHYEDLGLVVPTRSKGNIRLYSQRDIELLRRITRLTQDLGVNLAGVEVVLNMAEQIERLRHEVASLQEELQARVEYLRDSIRSELLETVRAMSNEDDDRWQTIILELEKRL